MNIIKNFSILSVVGILVVGCESSEKSDQPNSKKIPEYLGFWELEAKTEKKYDRQGLHWSHTEVGKEILEINYSHFNSYNYPYQFYYSSEYFSNNSAVYIIERGHLQLYSIYLPNADTLLLTKSKEVNGSIIREEEVYRYHRYDIPENFFDTLETLKNFTYNQNYFFGNWNLSFSALPAEYDKRFTKAFQIGVYDQKDTVFPNDNIPLDSLLEFEPFYTLYLSKSENFDIKYGNLKYRHGKDSSLFKIMDFDGETMVVVPLTQCYCDSIVMYYSKN